MPQGISPNPLNKISEVYLSQISEHHKKDVDGNTIPHEGEDVDEGAGLYANIHAKRKRGGKMRKKGDKGAPSSQDFANAARTAREGVEYTGPNKGDRKLIKKMDDPSYAKKLADYEKNMDPKKRQALKDKATKGMKFTHESLEEVEVDEAVSQSMRPSNMKKKAKLSAALDRLQALKVAKKKREMGEAFAETGMAKGSGKPSGVMKDFLDKRAKKLEKQRASQSQAARNNPAFDSTSPNSKDPAVARSRAEEVQLEAKYEAGASTYGKATIRNKRKFGTSGELPDPLTGKKVTKDATRGELITKRREEHKAKRGVKTKVKMEALSNWREDYVWEADEEQMEKEVKEKKVKNKIIINPKLGEAVEEIGGEVLEIVEMNGETKEDDPQLKSKQLRQRQLKKQVLLRKLQAVRQTGGEDITASYEPEGEQVDEVFGKLAGLGALAFATQRISSKLGTMHGNRVVKQALSKSPATSNSSSSSGGSNFQRGVNAIKDAKKSGTGLMNKSTRDALKMLDQYEPEGEQLDEYGNPRVGVRLRVARAIDKTNPKPRMGSKRSAISNKLKMSAIKAETKRREQKENPYSAGKRMKMVATSIGDRVKQKAKAMTTREDYIPEEEYDHYKDRIAMAGGDPSSPDKKDATTMPRRPEKPSKGMTAAQKAAKGRSALDIVKADIRKKYGKGAIMDVGKK